MTERPIIIKVGGSLLSGNADEVNKTITNLDRWLCEIPYRCSILIAGGGKQVDDLRCQYHQGQIDKETAHWESIRLMDENTQFLADRLNGLVIADLVPEKMFPNRLLCMIICPFLQQDDVRPDHLPHTWEVTSDSIAAHIAARHNAELILLKACRVPKPKMSYHWPSLSQEGIVDGWFPNVAANVHQITLLNLPESEP